MDPPPENKNRDDGKKNLSEGEPKKAYPDPNKILGASTLARTRLHTGCKERRICLQTVCDSGWKSFLDLARTPLVV